MSGSGFVYGVEPNLSAAEFRRILLASGLDARRPADQPERLERMLRSASLIVTARAYTPERALVGIARVLTDFVVSAHVCDLAVARPQQRSGIGRALLDAVREKVGADLRLILVAEPGAEEFCAYLGMDRVANTFAISGPGSCARSNRLVGEEQRDGR